METKKMASENNQTIEDRQLVFNRFCPPFDPNIVEAAIRLYLSFDGNDPDDEFIVGFNMARFDEALEIAIQSFKVQSAAVAVTESEGPEGPVGSALTSSNGGLVIGEDVSLGLEKSKIPLLTEALEIVHEPSEGVCAVNPEVHSAAVAVTEAEGPVVIDEDVALGLEKIKIPLVTDIKLTGKLSGKHDYPRPQHFSYAAQNVFCLEADVKITVRGGFTLMCQNCAYMCDSSCECCKISDGRCAYDGNVLTDAFFNKIVVCLESKKQLPNIKECWVNCSCQRACSNALLQRGLRQAFEVYFDHDFSVRNVLEIPKGSFLFEFVGEVKTSSELKDFIDFEANSFNMDHVMRLEQNNAYGFEQLYLDANDVGNVSRFLRRGTPEQANVVALKVFVESDRPNYFHLGIFSLCPLMPSTVLVISSPLVDYKELSRNVTQAHEESALAARIMAEVEDSSLPVTAEMLKSIVENDMNLAKTRAKNTKVVSSVRDYIELESKPVKPSKPIDHRGKGKMEGSPPKDPKRKSKRGRR